MEMRLKYVGSVITIPVCALECVDPLGELQRTIGQTDAGEKLAIQLQGVEESANRLGNAFDELKIALGETGILAAFTAVQDGLTSVVRGIAELPLWFRTMVVSMWGVAAAARTVVGNNPSHFGKMFFYNNITFVGICCFLEDHENILYLM